MMESRSKAKAPPAENNDVSALLRSWWMACTIKRRVIIFWYHQEHHGCAENFTTGAILMFIDYVLKYFDLDCNRDAPGDIRK